MKCNWLKNEYQIIVPLVSTEEVAETTMQVTELQIS